MRLSASSKGRKAVSVLRKHYRRVWCVDFEFGTGESRADAPDPRCMVAIDVLSGDRVSLWLGDRQIPECPLTLDDRSLYVAFYAPAETSCHVSLGWKLPVRVLDLYAELRWMLNGGALPVLEELKKQHIGKHSFLAALHYFGLSGYAVSADYKSDSQQLALRGGPFDAEDRSRLLEYNETDVVALTKLLDKMFPDIELPQALLRGRYMSAAGVVQHTGIPVDGELVTRLKAQWIPLVDRLIENEYDRFPSDYR